MAAWVETLAFTNANATSSTTSPTQTTIYTPSGAGQWAFSHGPDIAYFAGKYFVAFTNGRVGEGERGCRVTVRQSSDFSTWSDALLLSPGMGQFNEALFTSGGFLQQGGKLHLFYSLYEYDPRLVPSGAERPPTDVGHLYMKTFVVSTADGLTWASPKEIGPNIQMNRPPTPTQSGRLIMAGEARFDWTDDPAGASGWTPSGICVGLDIDSAATLDLARDLKNWQIRILCEGSFFQRSANDLVMFLRSAEDYLWVTRSNDNGVTWSEPGRTNFAHAGAKFHAGKLSNGRYFILGNPAPNREILAVWTSADGMNFDKRYTLASAPYVVQYPGFAKNGSYGYPSMMERNGELFVVCSRGKEAISGYRLTSSL